MTVRTPRPGEIGSFNSRGQFGTRRATQEELFQSFGGIVDPRRNDREINNLFNRKVNQLGIQRGNTIVQRGRGGSPLQNLAFTLRDGLFDSTASEIFQGTDPFGRNPDQGFTPFSGQQDQGGRNFGFNQNNAQFIPVGADGGGGNVDQGNPNDFISQARSAFGSAAPGGFSNPFGGFGSNGSFGGLQDPGQQQDQGQRRVNNLNLGLRNDAINRLERIPDVLKNSPIFKQATKNMQQLLDDPTAFTEQATQELLRKASDEADSQLTNSIKAIRESFAQRGLSGSQAEIAAINAARRSRDKSITDTHRDIGIKALLKNFSQKLQVSQAGSQFLQPSVNLEKQVGFGTADILAGTQFSAPDLTALISAQARAGNTPGGAKLLKFIQEIVKKQLGDGVNLHPKDNNGAVTPSVSTDTTGQRLPLET